MAGKIKLTIGKNASVKSDMSGFKSCSEKTKELLEQMDIQADEITLREGDEEVQTVSAAKQSVKA